MTWLVLTVPAAEFDLNKIERTIAKEPVYQTKSPRYCLLVFGPEAKTRVWLVLDGAGRPIRADGVATRRSDRLVQWSSHDAPVRSRSKAEPERGTQQPLVRGRHSGSGDNHRIAFEGVIPQDVLPVADIEFPGRRLGDPPVRQKLRFDHRC